ncbi:PTS sugar transporter subunit IIB [Clostridium polynesiense]|uniref:PTS sugar transporter subunit IIB n=1 Tax=Clostridium polynesiense TaxID=1325933 RepID=UPI00058BC993|nr:PTS sugar transporter subunit IIB [Clostridium polynesiense]
MANIKLIRADFRLIHGQVVTKWVKMVKADKIVVISDTLAKDEFMASIYIMAAPPGIEVKVYSVEGAVEAWKENEMGEGSLLILFKSVDEIYQCFNKGFPMKELQIGGLGAGPGRKIVYGPITLDKKDADMLREMQERGTRVYLHQVPEEASAELEKVLSKVSFD